MDRDVAAALYFHMGLSYQEILCALSIKHNIILSLRTLKRSLANQKLFRRKNYTDIFEVALFINEQLRGSGNMHGYRWMYLKCLQSGMIVKRQVVHALMQILDPKGIEIRKRGRLKRRQYFAKSPNFLWHLDSYDKLKPFGLCINGCIDGFSRHLIWLNVHLTNSNPKVIAGYFVEAVVNYDGCPQLVRGDMGTENGTVARIQTFLSGQNSFLFGASMHNQRIESFWWVLRRECCQFWMDLLGSLKDEGDFTGDAIDISLVQFCFTSLVQSELDGVVSVWNSHRIRRSKNENVPHGRPVVMYSMPEVFSTRSYMRAVDPRDFDICRRECLFRNGIPCDPEVFELLINYMVENELSPPNTAEEGLELYYKLRRLLMHDLLR